MIGRKQERQKVKELMASNRSEFLAITGRRRVGKTYLIDTLLSDHYCFSITGIQNGNTATQLMNFGIKLWEYGGTDTPTQPSNWQLAFFLLKAYLKTLDTTRKQVIFIDELPWVSTARSGFIQMLAHFWNDYLSKEKHFLLVICGSATSWISKKIINDPGGLHNRVTEVIHLHPFSIGETAAFFESKQLRFTTQELAKIYMALGGIPFYLEHFRKGESFAVAIERLCFSPAGILRNEYQNLYQALFNNAELHQSIVATLANHHYGLTHKEILKVLKIQATGSYQRAIEELILSDFIVESVAFGKKKRGTFYRLSDEYSVFYHKFIKGNTKYTPGIWLQLSASQSYKIWAGYAFESLCHKHIPVIKKALGITAVYTETSSFRVLGNKEQAGFQIDLLIDRKDNCINLCEIKFHAEPYHIQKSDYQQLLSRRHQFIEHTGTQKQVFLTFITNHGVVKNEYAQELVDVEVLLEEIIER